jgi:O-methyltransferase
MPTYAALQKIVPRLPPGGVVLVDDCSDDRSNTFRGPRVGYSRFVAEHGLPETYVMGMGRIDASIIGGGHCERR